MAIFKVGGRVQAGPARWAGSGGRGRAGLAVGDAVVEEEGAIVAEGRDVVRLELQGLGEGGRGRVKEGGKEDRRVEGGKKTRG